jgi:NADPH:quinone reductase-like Zn-dependent oxidoreductase
MKAVRVPSFGPPEVLSVDDVEVPVPGPNEALVRVHAVGVNRMDVELRAGIYGKESLTDFYFGKLIEFPHTPGIEPAGVVEAVGTDVEGLEVGQRVVPHAHLSCGRCASCRAGFDNACPEIRVLGVQTPGKGGYAEYFTWPAANLIPIADSLSFEKAASLLVNYGPVWFGLIERAELRPGETILVTGATGGCGHAALDIAKLTGARVIALAGSDEKAAELREHGADVVIDYRTDNVVEQVLEAAGGTGVDVALELVGADTWPITMACTGLRGRVVVIGSHGGIRAELNLGELFGKNLTVMGITRANFNSMARLVDLAGEGKLDPVLWRTYPLEEAAEAHREMDERRHSGKIVLSVA